MRWLADECVSPFLVGRLRDGGHDVLHMAEIAPGVPDSDIVKRADQDHRLLLTEDKDFGELFISLASSSSGHRSFANLCGKACPEVAAAGSSFR